MMTRRERLMATLRGEPVDRPPVSFYEIGGWKPDPDDADPFNIYSAPDWRPLLELAERETDLIRMMHPVLRPTPENCRDDFYHTETIIENGSRYTKQTLRVGGRTLTSLTRRDPGVSTVWTIEHLLKDADDARAYLELPDEAFDYTCDVAPLLAEEKALGEAGIVMVDVADPICRVASLFSMEDYTVLALTEPSLFHRLLVKHARPVYAMVEQVAREFPGHLWRVVGSEYASEPFLPPRLYKEYVVRYTGPVVETIQRYCGPLYRAGGGDDPAVRRFCPDPLARSSQEYLAAHRGDGSCRPGPDRAAAAGRRAADRRATCVRTRYGAVWQHRGRRDRAITPTRV